MRAVGWPAALPVRAVRPACLGGREHRSGHQAPAHKTARGHTQHPDPCWPHGCLLPVHSVTGQDLQVVRQQTKDWPREGDAFGLGREALLGAWHSDSASSSCLLAATSLGTLFLANCLF